MPKSKPFTIRLSKELGGWLERENRRTRLPKSALLEALAEESIRPRRFPGIGFRGPEHSRRLLHLGDPCSYVSYSLQKIDQAFPVHLDNLLARGPQLSGNRITRETAVLESARTSH